MERILVTGTDTEVGKSVVTACLAQALRARGQQVIAAKPVASGVSPGAYGEDAELLAAAAGHSPAIFARFVAPLSPHRAAALEDRRVDPGALVAWVDGLRADTVLVEGAGGWRVPIARGVQLADLVRRRPLPVVVVAADRLGVLNHTLLTIEAIRADGLDVRGVVLNRGTGDTTSPARVWNLEDLRALADVPVVPLERIDPTDPEARRLAGEALLGALDLGGSRRS